MTGRPPRLLALDVLRGTAVAGMVLVTSPGDWASTYAPLRHAAWNGWTPADMVFPTFLFGVGVALGLSFPRPLRTPAERRTFWMRVGRRVVALVLLGLCLEATSNLSIWLQGARHVGPGAAGPAFLRLPGILQRIAFCYGLATLLAVATARRDATGRVHISVRMLLGVIGVLLLGYWALMTFVPVPGFGSGRLDQEGNLAAWIDQALFTTAHLWPLGSVAWAGPVVYDPEGLLSGLPATTNVLFGVLAAVAWRRAPDRAPLVVGGAGAALFAAGLLLDPIFPINKSIWTSSFALLSSGFSAVLLATLATGLRSRILTAAATPLRVLGGNAILGFATATLLGRIYTFPFATAAGTVSPQGWAYRRASTLMPDPYLASLLCALVMVALVVVLLAPLHRRGIHFRL